MLHNVNMVLRDNVRPVRLKVGVSTGEVVA